jgi:hypothetical protein
MLTKPTSPGLYILREVKIPRKQPLTTLMMNMGTTKTPPLSINVTLNQKEDGAILHINCQSDGK